jgi:NAD(P)-dependent dehydrogenase (short-subunit alcohol dehydrogenase family)
LQKELLIFGANGALGKGVTKILSQKDFDKIYLFDSKFLENKTANDKTISIQIKDLTKEENVISAFNHIKPDKHTCYFLFSTIGGFWGGETIWETKLEDWNRMISLNLNANFLLAKHFAWLVKASAGGSICFSAAYTAENPESMKGAYGASKSALVHLVKTLAIEGQKLNLSANAISPYIIDTPANRSWMTDADFNKWIKPEEIGELVFSLFSSFNYINGSIITLKERFVV